MQLEGKHITVVGLGKTGEALAVFLKRRGAVVTVTDSADASKVADAAERLRGPGVRLALGGHDPSVFAAADLIVMSPGVPHTIEAVQRAKAAGVPVIGEIELAGRFIQSPIVAVTGTNGKTTVTRLIGQMLERSGLSVFVGGNLGTPLITCADGDRRADVAVAEISSFQLDTVETFRPAVGVLLNIKADHLDRYPDLRAYGKSKAALFAHQAETDVAVVNAADPLIMELTENIDSRRALFNADGEVPEGSWLEPGAVVIQTAGHGRIRIRNEEIPMMGRHNRENVSAAALAALAAGATVEGLTAAIREFRPDPHRLEFVTNVEGVNYYDDSKATNVDAVVRAIEAVSPPVILILGGRDKGGGYRELMSPIRAKVKTLVLMGESAERIGRELGGIVDTVRAGSMMDAVIRAHAAAEPGDTVLLSPACSSFDMYDSYARRGADFQRAVNEIGRQRA